MHKLLDCIFGYHLLCGKCIFTQFRAGKHSTDHKNLNTTDTNAGLKASLYKQSCVMQTREFKIFVLKICFDLYGSFDCTCSKANIINSWNI
jgi:hypothetical protein